MNLQSSEIILHPYWEKHPKIHLKFYSLLLPTNVVVVGATNGKQRQPMINLQTSETILHP